MTNQERVIAFLTARMSHCAYTSELVDAIVAYGIECASAEVEQRRAVEAERDELRAALQRTAVAIDRLEAGVREGTIREVSQ